MMPGSQCECKAIIGEGKSSFCQSILVSTWHFAIKSWKVLFKMFADVGNFEYVVDNLH